MARRRNNRGGSRTPTNPAPVSGPGALSRRTDGPTQPVRLAPAEFHGQRQQLETQQQAAPLAAAPGTQTPSPVAGGGGQPVSIPDAFRPTERPGEPVDTGADEQLDFSDPLAVLKMAYRINPDPHLLRLIHRAQQRL